MFSLSPQCNSSELSPLVVQSPQRVTYGQLLGPGQGFTVTSGQSTSATLCLSLSPNVHSWDALFDTVDVATYASGMFTPLNLLTFLPSPENQLCIAAAPNTTYFPIKRANISGLDTLVCSPSCSNDASICVFNTTAQATQCLCRCGSSGATCATLACPSNCSNAGVCNLV
ncbi:hypothetical protein B5M09_003258 [Aphanomyces astaci]|uniref:EGF-like domain-containing protein n=1 Tax=Aphanomyces astaci TaxID=112090 RepID=A0A425DA75_APHAT|nr:hypothetical protein B5M09_003258 [Aphanomyces astaci]